MLGVLLHVTVERRNLDRWCSETATADSGKQGRWRAGAFPPRPFKRGNDVEVCFH